MEGRGLLRELRTGQAGHTGSAEGLPSPSTCRGSEACSPSLREVSAGLDDRGGAGCADEQPCTGQRPRRETLGPGRRQRHGNGTKS